MEKKSAASKLSIIAAVVLIILGMVITVSRLIGAEDRYTSIINLIVYFAAIIYLCYDYKTPHGNLLKYLFLLFSAALALSVVRPYDYPQITRFLFCAPIILASYLAGRLNKIKDNTSYIIITEAVLLVAAFIAIFGKIPEAEAALIPEMAAEDAPWYTRFMILNPAIEFGAIALAYIGRFKDHLEAGVQ